jgi:hypothetical protein
MPALPFSLAARWLAAVALLGSLAACGSSVPTGSLPSPVPSSRPSPTPAAAVGTSAPAPTAVPTPTPVTLPSGPGEVVTSWGPAWDSIPAWFPRPDHAEPTQTGGEPASAELDVPGSDGTTAAVVEFYRTAMEVGNYAYSVNGPLEDGSFTVDAGDPPDCHFRIDVAPLGAHTLVRVFYGLGCRIE